MSVDNSTKIATLEGILASGLKSHTVDGVTTTYSSRNDIVAEINRLKAEDTVNNYTPRRRVRSINLGGF